MNKIYQSPISYGIDTDHAPLLLRKDLIEHLQLLKDYCGFRFARCHGILDDSIHVASRAGDDSEALPVWAMADGGVGHARTRPEDPKLLRFHFQQAHKVYANLLELGYTPLVELSFLPRALAADPSKTCCHYKSFASQPTSYEEWGELIHALGTSLVKRFGSREVSRWRFEVWNEPNGGFWFPAGDKFDEYMKLYAAAARALKRVSPRLQVGGPSTMVAGWAPPDTALGQASPMGQGGPFAGEGWIENFIRRCQADKIPLDFIETHLYPFDEYEVCKQKTREMFGPFDFFPGTIRKLNATIRKMLPGKDVIWGEWSCNHRPVKKGLPFWDPSLSPVSFQRNPQFDGPIGGAYAAKVAGTFLDGEKMCWWVGTDIYEESGWKHQPYHCGYGLLTIHGFPKPSAHAHHFAHRLDGGRILKHASTDGTGFLSVRKDRENLLLFWNFCHPELRQTTYTLDLRQAGFAISQGATVCMVDETQANGRATWKRLGSPAELSPAAEATIRSASQLRHELLSAAAVARQKLVLKPNAFGLIVSRQGRLSQRNWQMAGRRSACRGGLPGRQSA